MPDAIQISADVVVVDLEGTTSAAGFILGDLYDPASVPALLKALGRESKPAYYLDFAPGPPAANAALDSLRKIGSADAALVLKGDATIKRRRSGLLGGSALRGVLAAVGVVGVASAVAAYLSRRASEQEDPWARPLADPYVAPSAPVVAPAPAPVVTPVPAAVDDTPVMDPADTPAVPKEDVEVVDLTADGTPPSDGEGAEGGAGSEDGEGSGSEQAPRG